MTKKFSTIPLKMRWFAIILGMVFLFWIPLEDSSTTFPLLMSLAVATLGAGIYLSSGKKRFHRSVFNDVFAGSVAGLSVTPITLLLMALKTGLHGHPVPDFTNQQILSIIYRTPIWLLGGFLIGLGLGFWQTYRAP